MSKLYSYLAILIGAVCVYFLVRTALFPQNMILRNAIIQGALIGFGLAFVSAQVYARIKAKKVNGWITMYGLGEPGNGMFLRAAHAQLFPGPVNTAARGDVLVDEFRRRRPCALRGARLRHALPAGRTPAEQGLLVDYDGRCAKSLCGESAQPLQRQRSLRPGAETPMARLTFTIQNSAPAGHESNWLPAPSGNFILWLRVYIPGEAVLKGEYIVPPVVEVS